MSATERVASDGATLACHAHQRQQGAVEDRRHEESGYVIPMTALLLIPLMIFAALATDVGAWYIRADQAQRAADAAALAGTVWIPDETTARTVAIDTAARNGFRDAAWTALNGGTTNATVDVPGPTASGDLQVDVITESPSFFGALVLNNVTIHRRAVAAITPPVKMGNPSNGLGTGNLDVAELGVPPDGVWLALNGWCQDHRQGDPISVESYGAWEVGTSWTDTCGQPVTGSNPTLDPDGYTFVVDIPPGAGAVALEVFEPGACTDANTADLFYSAEDADTNPPRLNMRVFANDSTVLNDHDNLANPPVFDHLYDLTDCTGGSGPGGRWYQMHVIPGGPASEGKWYIQANVRQNTTEAQLNSVAIRARPTSDSTLCSSMLDPTCPEVYALEWLPIYRPSFGGAGNPSEFFLASIDDDHAGSAIEATMFDPGEGMDNVQFLDPAGNPMPFEWRRANCSVGFICGDANWPEESNSGNTSCGGDPCLDVTGSAFQDDWVVVTIDLPAGYSCGSSCWWKVRYTPEAAAVVTDRTTWGVRVVGGPIRLVD